MGNNSIDDEWDDLLGDEAPVPAVPKPVKDRQTASVVAVGRKTPIATPRARVEIPAPKRRSAAPEVAGVPKRGPTIDATRRLVVPPPPKVGPATENDGERGDDLPIVPTWGGADEDDRISIDPVTVPEPSDVIDLDELGARDQSANIRLDALHPSLPPPEPAEASAEDSLAALRRDAVDLDDAVLPPDDVADELVNRAAAGVPEPVLEATEDPVIPPPFQSATDLAGLVEAPKRPTAEVTRPAVPTEVEEHTPLPPTARADTQTDDSLAPMVAMAQPARSRLPWIAAAAVLVVGGLVWMTMGTSDGPETPAVAAASVATPPAPEAQEPDVPEPVVPATAEPSKVPSQAAAGGGTVPPTTETPKLETPKAETPKPETPKAETPGASAGDGETSPAEVPSDDASGTPKGSPAESAAAPADPPTASAIAPVDPEAAARYAEGAARYARDQSQDALEIMAKAGCAMDDGVKARSAFRKLTGGEVRKSVMISCRTSAVDLNAKGDEPTPGELLRLAERALDAGDHKNALALARKSNRIERSQGAVLVTALAACAAGDKEKAASMRRHLNKARTSELETRCPGLPAPE